MEVIPFRAVRPASDKVHLVATRSYVSYTPAQLRSKLNENPYSFLHIIHPDYSKDKLHSANNLTERFQKVRSRYLQFLNDGILKRDESPNFYVYRQTTGEQQYTGIIGAISIADYNNGKIKKHELTIAKRENTFTHYLDVTGINAEPVLLVNKNSDSLRNILSSITATKPEYHFTTTDKKTHEIWIVNDFESIREIRTEFDQSSALYIADGHHRCSSSANLADKRQKEQRGGGNYDHCLAFILDENEVKIHEFNRIIKDLGNHTAESFLKKLKENFVIEKIDKPITPAIKGKWKMYLDKKWYSVRHNCGSDIPDTEILSQQILAHVLGIHDLRKDKRIEFCEGPKGIDFIRKKVDQNKGGVGFMMPPVTVEELKRTADMSLTMSPKSTWIEPKLRSGLIVYELE